MASCQSQICADQLQEQIVRVSCKAYPNQDLDIEKAISNQDQYVLALLPSTPGKPEQVWEKKEIQGAFVLLNQDAQQILSAQGDEVVPIAYTVKGGSYPASVLWTEAASYIISPYGTVWTAEGGNQGIKIKLQSKKIGQANQQWNIKLT